MHMFTRFAIAAMGILLASLTWASPKVVTPKNGICHFHKEIALYEWLAVGGKSVAAHIAHGDCKVDDENPCTADRCDVSLGCLHTVDNSLCEDENQCTTDICDLIRGCQSTAAVDGTPCTGGVCSAGFCVPCVGECCCVGKECGPDGCGGSCGDCDPAQICVDGTCRCPTEAASLSNGSLAVPCCEQVDCAALACECRTSSDGLFCATGLTSNACSSTASCPQGWACFGGECTLLCQR